MTFKGLREGTEFSVLVTPKITVCLVVTIKGKDFPIEVSSNHAEAIEAGIKAARLEVDARAIGP